MTKPSSRQRCPWCGDDPLYVQYHDEEWGVPSWDDRHLFEMLCLEGAQAGLAWITILRKREGYRKRFHNFDIARCARLTDNALAEALNDPGIVRAKLKVEAIRKNARAAQHVIEREGSFAPWLWSFVDDRPVVNQFQTLKQIPATTTQSTALSKALKRSGFTFVGPTICYAFMQAVGMVNDHLVNCPRHTVVQHLV
ncbi:MAG: DNA-3-methyladenine glycosylase I [Phycisphaerales bacterium]|nr:DNA-3-methyladenine glycosylase I [Phycisphaerales bacterium]